MPRYHIAKSGKTATCQAQSEASCPLGGAHFNSRDAADFYAENLATLAASAPHTVRAIVEDLNNATAGMQAGPAALDDQELRARHQALTKLEMAEDLGEPEDVRDAEHNLAGMGYDASDPAWGLPEVQAEFLRRYHASKTPAQPTGPDQYAIDEADQDESCDHRGTGRVTKFDGGRQAILCERCYRIIGYKAEGQPTLSMRLPVEPQATNRATPSYLTDSVHAGVRDLDDETLGRHLKALTKYTIAKDFGEPSDVQVAADELNALGPSAAAYSWAPSAAQARVQAEFLRRKATVTLIHKDLTGRLQQAEQSLRELRSSSHPARGVEDQDRLLNKENAVRLFREQWGARIDAQDSYDGIRGVMNDFLRARLAAATPESNRASGWGQGLDLAYDYVNGYMRGA